MSPEQTYRDKQSTDDGNGHAFLWLELTPCHFTWALVRNTGTRRRGGYSDDCANGESEERQADELLAPVVGTEENDGEGLEPNVQERVDEADVDVEHEHDRLLEVEGKGGGYKDVDSEVAPGHSCHRNLGGRHD